MIIITLARRVIRTGVVVPSTSVTVSRRAIRWSAVITLAVITIRIIVGVASASRNGELASAWNRALLVISGAVGVTEWTIDAVSFPTACRFSFVSAVAVTVGVVVWVTCTPGHTHLTPMVTRTCSLPLAVDALLGVAG